MQTQPADLVRPPIMLTEAEAETLSALAIAAERSSPLSSRMLLEELDRAQSCDPSDLPDDVAIMGSSVTFLDEASGATHRVQLVYPGDADAEAGRISILTPLAAGLIGLRSGQGISWPNRAGQHRLLKVIDVTQPDRRAE
jgi:regulator of nucleoside diphosphate kinase